MCLGSIFTGRCFVEVGTERMPGARRGTTGGMGGIETMRILRDAAE